MNERNLESKLRALLQRVSKCCRHFRSCARLTDERKYCDACISHSFDLFSFEHWFTIPQTLHHVRYLHFGCVGFFLHTGLFVMPPIHYFGVTMHNYNFTYSFIFASSLHLVCLIVKKSVLLFGTHHFPCAHLMFRDTNIAWYFFPTFYRSVIPIEY